MALVTARGGNVIGGGDYSEDRIVPDIVRAWAQGDRPLLRMPTATRPWQHVARLRRRLSRLRRAGASADVPRALNFGPDPADPVTVAELTRAMLEALGATPEFDVDPNPGAVEMKTLAVDASRARATLGWRNGCRARRRSAGPPTGTAACGSAKARAPSRSARSTPMTRCRRADEFPRWPLRRAIAASAARHYSLADFSPLRPLRRG